MNNGNTTKAVLGIIFTLLTLTMGATVKNAIDNASLRADHISGSKLDKRLWVIENKVNLPHPND